MSSRSLSLPLFRPRERVKVRVLSWLVLALLFPGALTYADGWIHIRPPYPLPHHPRPHYLAGGMEVTKHHVTVTLVDESAEVTVDEVFHNPHNRVLEGTYYFPVPAHAAVDNFRVTLGGKELAGEILRRDEARRIYEQLVRQAQDPALLEYYGRELFRARVYPIPARGEVQVSIRYRHTIERTGSMSRFSYPLDTGRFSGGPYRDVQILVDATTTGELRSITSPSHPVQVERPGPTRAKVRYEVATDAARKDFELQLITGQAGLAGGVRSYRDSNEDGYFLLRISPGSDIPAQRKPNTAVFVIDTSGSMAGEKILHAKAALANALNRLRPEDSFQIVTFAARLRTFRETAVQATPATIAQAQQFVQSLVARGGTDLNSAVQAGIAAAQSHDDAVLLLLSDGAPTVGVIDPKKIVQEAVALNRGDTRLHILGIGHDVNTVLLDDVSRKNRGSQTYVERGAALESVVSAALDKVLYPCVTDLTIAADGVTISELEPHGPYDLFFGEDLVVTGRYRGNGSARLRCTGEENGSQRTFIFTGDFVSHGGADDVPYLWAQSRIMRLLDELRSTPRDAQDPLREQIAALGLRFGIVTPYTSFLVTEDASPLAATLRERVRARPQLNREAEGERSGFDEATGSSSFGYSRKQADRKKALIVGRVAEAKKEAQWREALQIRRIGGRAFFPVGNRFVDGSLQGKELPAPTRTLHVGSVQFMTFLRDNPGAARILAAGVPTLFRWNDEVVQVELTQDPTDSPAVAPADKTPPTATQPRERF
ncbi:MAG: VIT and VWA domain-containing protein [Planctomycetota bacterium]